MNQDSPRNPIHYLPNTDNERREMLRLIGLDTIEPLFSGIPDSLRNPPINLPSPLAELELISEMSDIAAQNSTTPMVASFLGGGAYNHFIPSAVRAITSRSEFYTSYTPYQPEVSQGTLQAIFEFQSLVCQLTGMDVANASMYDGSTALAEAALMSIGITHKRKLAIPSTIHPEYREVVKTYCSGRGLELRVMEGTTGCVSPVWVKEAVDGDTAALLLQYPNFFGCIEDISAIAREVHAAGALLIIATNPIALGLVRSPGSYGADIVTGEGQPLGIPTGFGGPFLGLLATREPYVRQLPGRLVGMTSDDRGQRGYVLTLQAREQHIRREKATSNICTNEGLCALAATVYLSLMGPRGLRQVAETCVRRAHYAASQIGALPGYSLPFGHTFFNEFVVRCPRPPSEINHRLLSAGILGGLELGGWYPDLADCLLLCVTEMNTRLQIDRLVSILVEFAQ